MKKIRKKIPEYTERSVKHQEKERKKRAKEKSDFLEKQ